MKLVTIDTVCTATVTEKWKFAVPDAWTDDEINSLIDVEGLDGFLGRPYDELCNFVGVENADVGNEQDRESVGHTIEKVESLPAAEAPTVHVLHWVHKHGANVFVFDSHDAVVRQKANIAQEWFEAEINDPEVVAQIGAALDNENWERAGTLYAEWMEERSIEFFQGFEVALQTAAT